MDKQNNSSKTSSLKSGAVNSPKETKAKVRGRKRKRLESNSDSDLDSTLPENFLEVEKSVQASAIKNNLDDTSVKKILKKVVTNDHVLALVKLREEEEASVNESPGVTPKRTRSKTKELMKDAPDHSLWQIQLSPIKEIPVKTRPEVTALIAQELPEDEDDEEYEPTNDDVPSDDDQTLESCSDIDSQPRTPATPQLASPCVARDGPFKVPQDTPVRRKLLIEEEEATIALRTRSKLSLSHTPIEHIESSFVPPDDIPPAVDDLWSEFLNGVLNPEGEKHDDDDEADPEYNVAADPDANDEDEDALERLLRISKKELNDLMTELLHVMPEAEDISDVLVNNVLNEQPVNQISTHWEGKQEPLSDHENDQASRVKEKRNSFTRYSIGKSEKEDPNESGSNEAVKDKNRNEIDRGNANTSQNKVNISIQEQDHSFKPPEPKPAPPPLLRDFSATSHTTRIVVDTDVKFLPEQILLLEQQLRQHIQLAASNFLQLYTNPTHWAKAPTYKEHLNQLHNMYKSNPKSVVNVCNLLPAIELVESWEKSVSEDTPENKAIVEFIQKEDERCRRRAASNGLYIGDFPETFKRVIANSTVFLYPYLLPPRPYRADNYRRHSYRLCEDALIALGLDQFWQYVYANPEIYKPPQNSHANRRWGLTQTLQLICKHLLPFTIPKQLWGHICKCKKEKDNPIAKFFANFTVEPLKHKLLPFGPNITLYEQPEHEMPRIWIRYLAQSSRRFRDYLYKGKCSGLPPAEGVTINMGEYIQPPTKVALPIDFTKTIVSTRINVKEKVPIVHTPDKYDLNIVSGDNIRQNVSVEIRSPSIAIENNGHIVGKLIPVSALETPTNSIVNGRDIANNIVLTPNIPRNDGIHSSNMTPNSSRSQKITICNGKILGYNLDGNSNDEEDEIEGTKTQKDITKESINYVNKTDVIKEIETREFNSIYNKNSNTINSVVSMSNHTFTTNSNEIKTSPIALAKDPSTKGLLKIVATSTGMILVPLPGENSDNNIETESISSNKIDDSQRQSYKVEHCKCCLILKQITKQKKITDYFNFKHKNKEKIDSCDCRDRIYPKISKRLKLLISNFKTKTWCVYNTIQNTLNDNKECDDFVREDLKYESDDIATVNSYQMKFIMRTGLGRDVLTKKKVYKCLSQFDPNTDDPMKLADLLYKHFGVDFVDLYKEFIMFLTPIQADRMGWFKDYFMLNIVESLVKKIEEEIKDKERRTEILNEIKSMTTISRSTACGICANLLYKMYGYPHLAKYVFDFFPHKCRQLGDKESSENKQVTTQQPSKPKEKSPEPETQAQTKQTEENEEIVEESLVIDYEANDSLSEYEDSYDQILPSSETQNETASMSCEDSNNVIDTPELTISKTEIQDYDSATDMSMLVMSDDNTTIKSETSEWTREEDKLILQTLTKHIKSNEKESILEIIEENNIYKTVAESLPDKSTDDIRNRVIYLINILVVNDFKG